MSPAKRGQWYCAWCQQPISGTPCPHCDDGRKPLPAPQPKKPRE